MRIGIIGRTQMLFETALALRREGHEIPVVITARSAPEYSKTEDDFRAICGHLGAEFILTKNINDARVLKHCDGLDLGVSINWPTIIQDEHILLFRHGILNAHFGDLPKYRGNACPNWGILNGAQQITMSIHFMEGGKLDCGRVVTQRHLSIDEKTTISDVIRWSEEMLPEHYVAAVRHIEVDPRFELKYADAGAPDSFRCFPRLPEDGFIDWGQSADAIHNLIRATTRPYPGAYTYQRVGGRIRKLLVLESHVVEPQTNDLAVAGHVRLNDRTTGESHIQCGQGVIAVGRCQYADEDESFRPGLRWKSIRMRLGVRVEDWLWELTEQFAGRLDAA